MPSYVLNNVTAPDNAPTQASTLENIPICDHVNIDVYNSGIYWAVKEAYVNWGQELQGNWQDETFQAPGSRTIYNRGGGIIGFRFRAAVPLANLPAGQQQAQVTVEAVQ